MADYNTYYTCVTWARIWNRISFRVSYLDISGVAFPSLAGATKSIHSTIKNIIDIALDSDGFENLENVVKKLKIDKETLIQENQRQSFARFYYLPWNVEHLTENVKELVIDFPDHSTIHPLQLSFFKNLSRLTLNLFTQDTLCQGNIEISI